MAPGESCLRFAKNSEDDGIQKYKIQLKHRAGLPNNFGRGVARAVYHLVSQSLKPNIKRKTQTRGGEGSGPPSPPRPKTTPIPAENKNNSRWAPENAPNCAYPNKKNCTKKISYISRRTAIPETRDTHILGHGRTQLAGFPVVSSLPPNSLFLRTQPVCSVERAFRDI